ncbi:PorT family protein [Brachyspira aalborgi]|uniref:PorT family protein n=1 Tax=Brachyspira aalborgi TaxID=29522 RepID=A0A5C8GCP3_9SPIR|nr:PorT family protein [Brachyspira aalborgi]
MKKIKKFLLTIAMTMIFSVSAFAASGFEFILNVPLGVGITMVPKDLKELQVKSGVGFEAGVTAQLGYMAQVVNGFGISALFELGYAHDSFGFKFTDTEKMSLALDSFQVGLLPKFNIGAFSIGIGGGVKVPLGGKVNLGDGSGSFKLAMVDALSIFAPPVIGYVKATFDYSIFFTDKLALNVGLYLAGDIAKIELFQDASGNALGISSFDIGVELGFKFGPKA